MNDNHFKYDKQTIKIGFICIWKEKKKKETRKTVILFDSQQRPVVKDEFTKMFVNNISKCKGKIIAVIDCIKMISFREKN